MAEVRSLAEDAIGLQRAEDADARDRRRGSRRGRRDRAGLLLGVLALGDEDDLVGGEERLGGERGARDDEEQARDDEAEQPHPSPLASHDDQRSAKQKGRAAHEARASFDAVERAAISAAA